MLFAVQFKTWYTCDWKHCYKRSLKPASEHMILTPYHYQLPLYDVCPRLMSLMPLFIVLLLHTSCPETKTNSHRIRIYRENAHAVRPRRDSRGHAASSAAAPTAAAVIYTEVIVQPLSVFMHWPARPSRSRLSGRHAAYVLCTGQTSVRLSRPRPVSVLLWSVTVGPIFPVQRRCRTSLNNTWSSLSVCLSICQAGCRPIIATNIQNI